MCFLPVVPGLARPLLLLLLLASPAAFASGSEWAFADGGVAGPQGALPPPRETGRPTLAVLAFESNAAAADDAPGIAALVAARLAEVSSVRVVSAADVESLLALEGQAVCAGEGCGPERERLLTAQYVVKGRLDRYGSRYVLSASVLEPGRPVSAIRPEVEVMGAAELPTAARQVADLLARGLGLPAPAANPLLRLDGAPPVPGILSLGLRVDSTIIRSFSTLTPGAELEVGFAFHPEWVAFLQVGVRTLRVEDAGGQVSGLDLVPGLLGTRHLYTGSPVLQPYWGLALGVQLAFGTFGFFRETGPLPAFYALVGLQVRIIRSVSVVVEGRTNVAQATLGLSSGMGQGLNLELSAGLTFEFH
jgi:TolB-like protein